MPLTATPPSRSELTRLIAPCGLYCGGCLAFSGGAIRNHARALHDLLGPNFAAYARRLGAMSPALLHYPDFSSLLEYLSLGSCKGCREGGCLLGNCGVRACALKREIDFCGLCPDFPCANPGLPEELVALWRKNNQILRDKGAAAYLDLVRTRPRYP